MAAGVGERMKPITDEMPKPLIKVNGTRMIDSVIDALHNNGITEIYIVIGHLKDKFDVLNEKYNDLIFIENPYYKTSNNISSLYMARNHIKNSIILDGDQIIYDESILKPEFDLSGYNAVWTEDETKEWLLTVENGIVKNCNRTGGNKGWQLYSISRWNSSDGEKLKRYLEIEFEENKNTKIYWDDIPMFCYPQEFELGITKMNKGDVVEIDSVEELIQIDNSYSEGSYK